MKDRKKPEKFLPPHGMPSDGCEFAFSSRVPPKALTIKIPYTSWNYQYIERLIAGGQLAMLEMARPGNEGVYQALRLTDRGRDILAGAEPIPGNEAASVLDGHNLDAEIEKLDAAEHGTFHVFCEADPYIRLEGSSYFLVARAKTSCPPELAARLERLRIILLETHRSLSTPRTSRELLDMA